MPRPVYPNPNTVIDKAIDPARVGLSKSLMTSPCERKGAYGELVRDDKGRRLSFPMNEKVIFGRAIDSAHAFIVWHDLRGEAIDLSAALVEGLKAASAIEASEEIDWSIFSLQVANALTLFMEQPDGLARIREHYEGLRFQGDNGRSLRAEDDIIGTPDYMFPNGVLDVKTSGKSFHPSKFYRSPEMPVYALLFAAEQGELPAFLAYQVYVRKAKPEWKWLETAGTVEMIALGRLHANHWRRALAAGDIDLFPFDTTYCNDCPWKNPIPEVGHEGCPIGQLVPVEQEEAA